MEPLAAGGEGRRRPFDLPDRAALSLLLLGTAYVFGASGGFSFVGYDDGRFVYENATVLKGLSAEGARWAFTTFHLDAWHPMAWLSHMADVSLFGLDAGAHHLVSAALHAVSSLLLYLAFRSMTGAPWRSLAVALLFAVHPLHVESVAWVAERKDVLCGLFWNGGLAAYAAYARRGGAARYGALLLLFALALLSKPMAVTFPFALLLLDWWPLGRLRLPGEEGGVPWRRLAAEKAPLLLLAAAAGALTLAAQGTAEPRSVPAAERFLQGALSAVTYLGRTLFPAGLACFYPPPSLAGGGIPAWKGAASALALLAASAAAILLRRRPWLPVGWFWYLGTLAPVLGIVGMGGASHASADRYTYLPLVGIFAAAAWSVPEPRGGWDRKRLAAAAAAGALLALLLAEAARRQAATWRDDEALFSNAAAATEGNWVALTALGASRLKEGRPAEAVPLLRGALEARPSHPAALLNLGDAYLAQGRPAEALPFLEQASLYFPGDARILLRAGQALHSLGRREEALSRLREATDRDPSLPEGWFNLGTLLLTGRDAPGAEAAFRRCLALRPGTAEARNGLGVALLWQGRRGEAGEEFRAALRIDPGYGDAAANLEGLR